MIPLRVVSAVMALLCLVCVVLQYNDPDPLGWMAIYGAAAIVCAAHAWRGSIPRALPLSVGAIAVIWGVFLAAGIRGRFEWHQLAESMHAGTPQIEQSRESLGLFLVAAWMIVVTFGVRRRGTSAASAH